MTDQKRQTHQPREAIGVWRHRGGRGGSTVLGSGVLVSIEGRRGIFTCGHVAEQYENLLEIGVTSLIAGMQQGKILNIADAHTIIVQSNNGWTENDLDLAFIFLNPRVADSVAVQSVIINIEKNLRRIECGPPNNSHAADVMFGLVAEYSGKPVIEDGKFVSPMRAVIYRGNMHSDNNALLRFQTIDGDPEKLPRDFGGLSGSGLWRIHFVDHGEGRFDILEKRLLGISSWQVDKQNNRGAVIG